MRESSENKVTTSENTEANVSAFKEGVFDNFENPDLSWIEQRLKQLIPTWKKNGVMKNSQPDVEMDYSSGFSYGSSEQGSFIGSDDIAPIQPVTITKNAQENTRNAFDFWRNREATQENNAIRPWQNHAVPQQNNAFNFWQNLVASQPNGEKEWQR